MLDFVIEQLQITAIPLTQICHHTGVKRSWLWQLKDGRIPDPSVRRIQVLHDYFRLSPATPGAPGPNDDSMSVAPPSGVTANAGSEVAGG